MSRRLSDQGIEPSAATRRDYCQLLLTAPGLRTMVNGIVVGDESFDQSLTTACRASGLSNGAWVTSTPNG
ncbi:fructose-bisphosphate aldolase [Nocardioides allogilvus]|uniref:fructose-bisphosphate aldolase n=1 Tax=Nocardioides allogilvus TaxID=2072017 RepID=UPI000D31E00A